MAKTYNALLVDRKHHERLRHQLVDESPVEGALALGPDKLLHGGIGLLEIGVVAVHLVDDEEARQIEFVCIAPGQLGADFHARHGIH